MLHNFSAPLPIYSNIYILPIYPLWTLFSKTSISHDLYSTRPLFSATSISSFIYLSSSIYSFIISILHDLYPHYLQNLDLPMNYSLHSLSTLWPFSPMNSIPPRLISYKTSFLHDFYTPLPLLPMICVHQDFILQSIYNPWSLSSMTSNSLTSVPHSLLSSLSSILSNVFLALQQYCQLIVTRQ